MKTDAAMAGSLLKSKTIPKELTSKKLLPPGVPGKPGSSSPDFKVDLSSKATSSIPTAVPTPSVGLPDLPEVKVPKEVVKDKLKDEAIEKSKATTVPEVKNGSVKKPSIIFIKGLDLFSSPSKSEGGYAGISRIADSIEDSKVFSWSQKKEIIDEIRKTHHDFPVILVGHSLGGDTAVEVADELDSLQEGFRKVDLLVTIDSIGFSNDILPQNVKNHLNVFGENSLILNGGPHVARRDEKTQVRNILSPLDHTDIDDDREVQFEVVDLIQKTLKK